MSRTYCHTHSAYDCQTCADEILSLGIQADKDRIKWLESEVARLEACAAELATLREKAAMVDELRKRAERMQKALSDIAEWTDRYTTPGHPVSTIARAAIAQCKGE